MNKIILLLILLSNPIIVSGQIRNHLIKNDLELLKLKGSIKVLIDKKFKVKHITDSTYILEDYKILEWEGQKYKFNRSGYKTEHLLFDLRENSSLDSLKWIYHYDLKNRLKKEVYISFSKPADTSVTNYSYPNDTLIIKRNEKTEIQYIIKDNQEVISSLTNNDFRTKKLYQYDNFNRLIRHENYQDKNFIQQLHVYTYKDTLTDNVYQQVNIWPVHNNSSSYTKMEYDKLGNPTRIYSGRFDNENVQKFQIKYEYDLKGNWIRMEYFNQNNTLSEIRTRTINYY